MRTDNEFLEHLSYLFSIHLERRTMKFAILKLILRLSSENDIEHALIDVRPGLLRNLKVRNLRVAADKITEMMERNVRHGIGITFPTDEDTAVFSYKMTTNEFAAIIMRATAWQINRKEQGEKASPNPQA